MSAGIKTYRDRFTDRFPSADADESNRLIEVAELLFGESPDEEFIEGLLDVAAARLSGNEWTPNAEEEAELDAFFASTSAAAACVPETALRGDAFLAAAFAHLGKSDKAPSGRVILRGSVYCAQPVSGGRIKIGFSTDVQARFFSLNGASPEPLVLLAHARTYDFVERDIHAQLSKHRRHCEWFADDPEVLEVVATLAATCRRHELARPLDLPAGGKK